jgi:hypothetical protein
MASPLGERLSAIVESRIFSVPVRLLIAAPPMASARSALLPTTRQLCRTALPS